MSKPFFTLVGAAVAAAVAAVLLLGGQPAQAASPFVGMQMTVHKSPLCGCCGEYIAILRQRGAAVTVIDSQAMAVRGRGVQR